MFRRKTVFVVGAGASKELELPTGAELSVLISQACEVKLNQWGDAENAVSREMIGLLLQHADRDTAKTNNYLQAMQEIRRALPFKDSIDAVIDQFYDRPEIAEIGKFLIAKLILEAEAKSLLRGSREDSASAPDLSRAKGTWLHAFTRMLFEGLRADQLEDIGTNVVIVCFNYDRCIERYLTHAISEAYGLEIPAAIRVAGRVRIVHVYGSLGALPEWTMPREGSISPFGFMKQDLWKVASNLKTFSESVDSDTDETIKSIIRDGEQYVYLGLAFGRQNMDLLSTDYRGDEVPRERDVYASGKGQFEQGRPAICKLLQNTYAQNVRLRTIDGSAHPLTRLELGKTASELLELHRENILA